MAEMRRESPYAMIPVPEALALIAAHTPLLGEEELRSVEADGRVLAEDLFAPEPIPDLPKSTVDGYALRSADGLAPRQVLGELTAGGHEAILLTPGTAVRIMTGAPLPSGADAVIMVEETAETAGTLTVRRQLKPGDYVLPPGSDLRQGQLVLARGDVIGPAEIGLLVAIGRTTVRVFRRPTVAVLSTGDEVYEPDVPLPPGGVRDSNRYAIMAGVRAAGCRAVSLGRGVDDYATLHDLVKRGLEQADVLISSGGVSMGTRDLIKPLLAEMGKLHFGRVFFKPGKPTSFATIGTKLAFGLPGNPASALVSFEIFVRPALRRLQGDARPERPRVQVLTADPIQPGDREEYQRVAISWEQGRLVARSTGSQSSSRLMSLHGANGLLIVPPGNTLLPAGTLLEALLTDPLY